MGLGWGVAYQIFFAKADINIKYGQLLFWGIFLSSWAGSKLLFYFTTDFTHHPDLLTQTSFWTGGGFVFYGGLIFAVIFLGFYKLLKLPISRQTFWALLPALTFGHAIGRIGCLLAGCCFGKETDLWWGINLHGAHRHPAQALESFGLFIIAFYIWKAKPSLRSLSVYLVGYGLLRFGVEMLRGDEIRGLWGPLTPSQWISLALILTGITAHSLNNIKQLEPLKPK
jgi:phosphatidylglycerol:prolipoprotein diacylglycerol transferase